MEFKDNVPIYIQIEQYLYRQIVLGKLEAGHRIPSVRQLAVDLTVNVNTVQRALQEMNNQGILFTKRGEGNFVTEDTELITLTKKKLLDEELDQFVENMHSFGITKEQVIPTLQDYLQRRYGNE
ncbi:GntR family transcriptional regulator [Lactobacillus psittaci]|uniref:Transcriptional regulator n=1 Tax=Lactobacillus psittaci DSM 15354 TaxID=1122152 RepID=A0A0R1S3G1_9LACO|nr:GntR family transcriptional regulator [Lactobacillus psittaci]KRL63645.1 transcriptional regulator [Lactobacillus psittaci DSM 15354]